MKILCVIDNLGSGGAQRQLVELVLGFKEKGHDVCFLVYHNINFYMPIVEKNNISLICIQESNYFKRLLKMRNFIRKGKFNAVLSFLEAPNFICEITGIPYRNWKLVVGERSANPRILKSLKLRMYRWFHVFADFVVANSKTNLEIVRKVNPLLPRSKCKVIYNLIDNIFWKSTFDYIPRKNGKLKLLVVASHQYLKNLNGLVDALSLLDNYERSKLTVEWYGDRIVGPFTNNSFLEGKRKIEILKLEDLITFYPATNEITQKIQEADAIGLFSFYEGLPNVVCEGMACAKPIICSKVSDVPDFLSFNKNLLCDPFNPQSIKETLSYLINLSEDQLIQIGAQNRKISKEKFNKESIISDYLALFSK